MATKIEIEQLKQNWKKDPCWDIESTEGFEEHAEELLLFRRETELEKEEKFQELRIKRLNKIVQETGCVNFDLKTYSEIALSISGEQSVQVAQVHATLLVAAQMQRIADKLTVLISKGKKA